MNEARVRQIVRETIKEMLPYLHERNGDIWFAHEEKYYWNKIGELCKKRDYKRTRMIEAKMRKMKEEEERLKKESDDIQNDINLLGEDFDKIR